MSDFVLDELEVFCCTLDEILTELEELALMEELDSLIFEELEGSLTSVALDELSSQDDNAVSKKQNKEKRKIFMG